MNYRCRKEVFDELFNPIFEYLKNEMFYNLTGIEDELLVSESNQLMLTDSIFISACAISMNSDDYGDDCGEIKIGFIKNSKNPQVIIKIVIDSWKLEDIKKAFDKAIDDFSEYLDKEFKAYHEIFYGIYEFPEDFTGM